MRTFQRLARLEQAVPRPAPKPEREIDLSLLTPEQLDWLEEIHETLGLGEHGKRGKVDLSLLSDEQLDQLEAIHRALGLMPEEAP